MCFFTVMIMGQENPSNTVDISVPQTWSRKLSGKWSAKLYKQLSGKCSPEFGGEFREMFPTDRLSIFDGIWAVPRHFFRCLRKNV